MGDNILKEENIQIEKLLSMNYLTCENSKFYETPGGFAGLVYKGKDYGHVNIVCAFPLSSAETYLSVRSPDGKQDEIGIIQNLSDFNTETIKIIRKQLKLRYFMPKIERILDIKEEYGYTYWTVVTDKGKCKFASSSGSSGAILKYKKGIIIKDAHENRYLLEDLKSISPKEMKKLELYL